MSEPSSSYYIQHVFKLSFYGNKRAFLFYLCLFVAVILVSVFVGYNREFSSLFYLSFDNPLGIVTSLFLYTDVMNGAVNIVSASLVVFTYFLVKALIDTYGIVSTDALIDYFILTPLLASITSNSLVYAIMFLVKDYQSLQFSGFHEVVQGLIGFTLATLLIAFLKIRNWSRYLPVFVALFLIASLGFLLSNSFLSGFIPSTLYDFSKLLSLQISFFTGLTYLQFAIKKQKVG